MVEASECNQTLLTNVEHSSIIVDDTNDEFFPSEILSFQEFDQFINHAQEFVSQCRRSNSSISSGSVSRSTTRVPTSMLTSFWTQKSHVRKTLIDFKSQEEIMDTELRKMVSDSLEKVGCLGMQASHLRIRLNSCIQSNAAEFTYLTDQLQYLKGLSDELSSADLSTRQQLHFVNAVMEQRDVQIDRCMTALLNNNNWVDMASMSEQNMVVGSFTTKDRALVVKRLHLIREAQAETNACYTLLLHRRQSREQTLGRVTMVRDRLLKAPLEIIFDGASSEHGNSEHGSSSEGKQGGMRGYGITIVDEERNSDRTVIDGCGLQQCGIGLHENEGNYDHTLCSDCTVVADLANECLCRLLRMQKVASASHCRLQRLLFIREDLIDIGSPLQVAPTSQK